MAIVKSLSAPQCVLLAVRYAAESNIAELRALTALREDALELGLILRLLLTYLPESTEPSEYIEYVNELATDSRPYLDVSSTSIDAALVKELSESHARKRVHNLHLLPLAHPLFQAEPSLDPLTLFIIHRSYRIDAETGLLDLIPQLVVPFLEHSAYLRTWFISAVLPLLRLGYEYYPRNPAPSLDEFTQLRGRRAIELQLANLRQVGNGRPDGRDPGRDLRGVVGPWICGADDRKRRKLNIEQRRASIDQQQFQDLDDWECLFEWLVHISKEDFSLVVAAISEWDGPNDIDFGGYNDGHLYIDEDRQRQLELRYAQAALACLYSVESHTQETLQTAYHLLVRLSNLLGLDVPAHLNGGVDSLPSADASSPISQQSTTSILQDENILRTDNPITQPNNNSIRILELFLFSAFVLATLQYPISIRDIAKSYIRNDHAEQYSLVQRILHTYSSGPKKESEEWKTIRRKILWLWNWGSARVDDATRHGQGIFGQVESKTLETELLKALLESGHYPLAIQIYIRPSSGSTQLPIENVERVVLQAAMRLYDNASNGNRTRGGMKRASDMVAAFSPSFSTSARFQRMRALLSATHAMSFYSLTVQHGVPFQPVDIRANPDPLSLIRKLLSQNSRSYTKLDDLIYIGQNLVTSMPSTIMSEDTDTSQLDSATMEQKTAAAERRIIGMAIGAALEEDDFETAYSYVVNRLTPPSRSPAVSPAASTSSRRFSFSSHEASKEDGPEEVWRAALLAGRYGSSPMSSSGAWSGTAGRPGLRRLEQRMELLSQALLLAPPEHLEEVLAVWQQCEAEMTTFLADEAEAEEKFNDLADRRLPGAFHETAVPALQPRREVGRGAVEEAPVGLFDLARGAAAAFSRSAFPLRNILFTIFIFALTTSTSIHRKEKYGIGTSAAKTTQLFRNTCFPPHALEPTAIHATKPMFAKRDGPASAIANEDTRIDPFQRWIVRYTKPFVKFYVYLAGIFLLMALFFKIRYELNKEYFDSIWERRKAEYRRQREERLKRGKEARAAEVNYKQKAKDHRANCVPCRTRREAELAAFRAL